MDDQNNLPDDQEIVEGEVTQDATPGSAAEQLTVIQSLEELIKNNIDKIDRLREETRKQKEMFDDSFNNNPVFIENDKQVKEIAKKKSETRQQIMKQPAVQQLADKIKSMRLEMKEAQAALSDYLLEYQRLTNGVDQIEGHDGEVRRIINSSKVVKESTAK